MATIKQWFDHLDFWTKVIFVIVLIILAPLGIIFFIAYLISWLMSSR